MSENFMTRIRSRRNNLSRTHIEHAQIKQESNSSQASSSRKKSFGPFKIKNVCGPKGIGIEPERPEHNKGFWFIAHLPENYGGPDQIWVRSVLSEAQLEAEGIVEANFVDRLFYIKANSNNPIDLCGGEAHLVDDVGTHEVRGITENRMQNKLESTVPASVAPICGAFGFKLPNIGDIMSKLGQGD